MLVAYECDHNGFPISRDPPEGGTIIQYQYIPNPRIKFPISRDPPEGGTTIRVVPTPRGQGIVSNF